MSGWENGKSFRRGGDAVGRERRRGGEQWMQLSLLFFLYIVTSSSCSCVHVCEEKTSVWTLRWHISRVASRVSFRYKKTRDRVRQLAKPADVEACCANTSVTNQSCSVSTSQPSRLPSRCGVNSTATRQHSVNKTWGRIDDNLAWLKIGHMLESA